ncbi:DUF4350 domain-containing protein [Halobacterium yunchengense]|uniref:DUF4350 domain-containing protein n=1 Tax=Halobacterium yunchengense TaxID=3108497 RepID=UPI00300BBD6C
MRARDVARAVGVVAVVAAVVVAAAYAGGAVLSAPSGVGDAPDAPAYDTGALATGPVEDDGEVTAPSGGESKTVVFDVSHGNDVSENDVQPVVDALVAAGHEVRFYAGSESSFGASQGASPFNETLRGADALVVVSPSTAYTDAESDGVEAFADAGGRVLLAANPPATAATETTVSLPGLSTESAASAAGQPANLAARFDVTFGAGYLYDMGENGNNFQRVYAGGDGGGVAEGVERAVLLDATPLRTGPDASAVLSAEAASSETREDGTYAVAARNGNVLAVGDADVLTAGVATDGDNDAFVSNVAAFLVSGDKEAGAPSGGQGGGQPGGQPGGGAGNSTQPTPTARLAPGLA